MQSSGGSGYDDFELEIGIGSGLDYRVTVIHSAAGETSETMHFPFDELALENRLLALQNALLRSGGKRRMALSEEEKTVQDFGKDLWNSLLKGEVRNRYDVSLERANREGKGLRLKLRIQEPKLAALPWEFLYDPHQAEYMCLSRGLSIVRYLELPQPTQSLAVEPPLRILGMTTSPIDLHPLDIAREKQRVEEAIKSLQENGLVELTWLQGQTWRDLQEAMQTRVWHIFYFIGHGGFDCYTDEGLIALADEDGNAQRFRATHLGRLLAGHRSLKLVILNSCEGAKGSQHDIFSGTASILVQRGIPAVLAMQYEITDRAAIEFARAFFRALANGLPVDAAVTEARMAVSFAIENTIEWGTPVLYMRSPDGVLFNIQNNKTTGKRQKELSMLYSKGMESLDEQDLQTAVNRFKEVVNIDAGYKDASARLKEAERQLGLAKEKALRDEERKSRKKQLEKEQRDIELKEKTDTETKIKAQKGAERLEQERREQETQQAELSVLYSKGIEAMAAQDWQMAIGQFKKVLSIDAGYKDASARLEEAADLANARIVQQMESRNENKNREKKGQFLFKKPLVVAVGLGILLLGIWIMTSGSTDVPEQKITTPMVPLSSKTSSASEWNDRCVSLDKPGSYQEALNACNKALDINPQYKEAWSNKGDVLSNLSKYQEALDAYNKALDIDPQYKNAWAGKGSALSGLDKYQEAMPAFNKALDIDPQYIDAWAGKGGVLIGLNRSQEALDLFNNKLVINLQYKEAWAGKGSALIGLGRYQEALSAFDKALDIDPRYESAWNGKGAALFMLNRYQEALDALNKALDIDPQNKNAWVGKGMVLSSLGRYQEAISAFDKALDINPQDKNAWAQKGSALVLLNRYQEAISAFDKALDIDPQNKNAWVFKCVALNNLDRPQEALNSCNKALDIDPQYDLAWLNKGYAFFGLGRYQEAVDAYDKALDIDPQIKMAWFGKGAALNSLGRYQDAINAYDKALDIDPQFELALAGKKTALKNLRGY